MRVRLSDFKLIYLATPYSLVPEGKDYAYEMACGYVGRMTQHGLRVYSPITHWHGPSLTHFMLHVTDDEWLEINRPAMSLSDALVVPDLQGWDSSRGIAEEVVFFKKAKKPTLLIDNVTLNITRRL